jgi:hypothetical protein
MLLGHRTKLLKKILSGMLAATFLLTGVAFSNVALAKDIKVTVNLDNIAAAKMHEDSGEEIYLSVTTYPRKGTPVITRVPMFPLHWIGKELGKIKNVTVWEGTFKEGDGAQIIISLVEQDLPPWDMDDHVGSVKLTLANTAGKFEQKWDVNYKDQSIVTQDKKGMPKFTFSGQGSEYTASFSVVRK